MKVAYVGNFGAPHSTENELRRAMAEGHGWEVTCYPEDNRLGWDILTETLRSPNCPFDFVLWTRTASLSPPHEVQWAMIEAAEKAGVPTAAAHLDRWWGLRRENEVRREPFFRCAHVFTADGGHDAEWASLGINHHFWPPGVSEYECVPGTPRPEYASDLVFCGSWDGYGHAEAWHRPALVAWLKENYGDRVGFWPKAGQHALRGQDLRDLYASCRVAIGDSCILSASEAEERGLYLSDRVPETIGRGLPLMHPWTKGIEYLFPSVATWTMGEWDRLGTMIDELLAQDDDWLRAWGEEGRTHVLATATYTVRTREIAETLGLA